jgi:hypothetical protein
MFVPPNFASLAIFSNNDSQPHAGATITSLAGGTKFYQSSAQFIAVRSNRNGLRRGACAILWRNDEPSSVGPRLIWDGRYIRPRRQRRPRPLTNGQDSTLA